MCAVFWNYKVFVQLLDYIEALENARNLPVIKGTPKQKEFWEQCAQVQDWLPWVVFINRELPQYEIHSMEKTKCPDLYRVGRDMIKRAHENFDLYLQRFGATNAWIEEPDPDSIQFTDIDFPQIMGNYELQGGSFPARNQQIKVWWIRIRRIQNCA